MGFWEWLTGKNTGKKQRSKEGEIACGELFGLAQEIYLRELAFTICVNMVANALGKCDLKTYKGGVEIQDREFYLWNIEPNTNQSSTVFLHKLISMLYLHNEVLVISTKNRDGNEYLAIADSFAKSGQYPVKENEYTGVTVGEVSYNKSFKEHEVLHLTLNNKDVKKLLDGLYQSYGKLIQTAQKAYNWSNGQHWKVKVASMAQGGSDWQGDFQKMMEDQVKPFLQAEGAVLPEFEGYQYENVGGEGSKDTRDIRALFDDIFDFTARAFHIPTVLLSGEVAGTADAFNRWLTLCIDPLCDQLQEEIVRKRYGFDQWKQGNYLRIDTSSLIHFDVFANANAVDKLIASGAFSINEVRRAAGQQEIDEAWANVHMITKNYAKIDEALEQVKGGGTE